MDRTTTTDQAVSARAGITMLVEVREFGFKVDDALSDQGGGLFLDSSERFDERRNPVRPIRCCGVIGMRRSAREVVPDCVEAFSKRWRERVLRNLRERLSGSAQSEAHFVGMRCEHVDSGTQFL